MKNIQQIKAIATNTVQEACIQGSAGAVYEAAMYFKPFGFNVAEIMQPVHFWYGLEDNTVTKVHADFVEKVVPKSVMHYKPHEGHLSIYIKYFEEVLQTIQNNSKQNDEE